MTKVYYPSYGIAIVKGTKEVMGHKLTILQTHSGITILARSDAFRPLIDRSKADEVLAVLKSKADPNSLGATWNRRYREYLGRVASMDVLEVASVLRDLKALAEQKDLSFGERKMLDHARGLLFSELEEVGAI